MAVYVIHRRSTPIEHASWTFGYLVGLVIRATFSSFLVSAASVLASVAFAYDSAALGVGLLGLMCLTLVYTWCVRHNYLSLLAVAAFPLSLWAAVNRLGSIVFLLFLGSWGAVALGGLLLDALVPDRGKPRPAAPPAPPTVIARYSGDGCQYVARAHERRGDHVRVQFAEGTAEWVHASQVGPDDLRPGEIVAAYHRTLGEWHPAMLLGRGDRAVTLRFGNGFEAPADLFAIRVARRLPAAATLQRRSS